MNAICAYCVNLDAVCNVRAGDIYRLLPAGLSTEEAEKMEISLKGSITRMEDLVSSLLYCMREGSGAEILIESPDMASRIGEAFSWDIRLGGNAGIMANVLAHLGAKPILNAPALGPRLAALLHPGVLVPLSGALAVPRRVAEEMGPKEGYEPVHFVFQFSRGLEIKMGRNRFIVPEDDRFFASYDPVNTSLESSPDFDSYCLEHISDYAGALVSGLHLVPLQKYRAVLQEKMDQLRSWKESHPDLFIHMELGSFQSPRIFSHLLDLISQVPIDSLGMNEDELGAAAGLPQISAAGNPPFSWQERMHAAQSLQEKTGVLRVAVHTRDYILSVMNEGLLPAKDEIAALQSGVDSAASLAAGGSLLIEPPAQFNETGLAAAEELCRQGASRYGRGAALHSGGRILSLIPARQVLRPRITVGLGDTATASIFFRQLCAIKGHLGPV